MLAGFGEEKHSWVSECGERQREQCNASVVFNIFELFSILTEWLHCVKNRIHILNEEIGEIAGLTLNEVNYWSQII